MSGGGLKVGDLYVSVSASIGEMVKGLDEALEAIEDAADDLEGHLSKASAALGDMSEGLLSFAAVGAAAFAVASQSSAPAAEALEELKTAVTILGTEVGELLIPTVRELTGYMKTAIATWRGLDSGLKQNLVTAVRFAAVYGTAGLALSRGLIFVKSFAEGTVVLMRTIRPLVGILGGTGNALAALGGMLQKVGWGLVYLRNLTPAELFAKMTAGAKGLGASLASLPGTLAAVGRGFVALLPQLATASYPVLAVAAAVGAFVLLAGTLRKNWGDLSLIMRETTADMVDGLRGLAERTASFFGGLWDSFKAFIVGGATTLLELVARQVRAFARFLLPVTEALRMGAASKALKQASEMTGKGLVDGLLAGGELAGKALIGAAERTGAALAEATKGLREGVVLGLKDSAQGAKMLGQDLAKGLGMDTLLADLKGLAAKIGGFQLGDGSNLDIPREVDVSAVGKTDFSAIRDLGKSGAMTVSMQAHADAVARRAAEIKKAAAEMAQAMAEARDALVSKFMSRTGDVASLIETGMQGAAVGGALGALVAVIGDLVTRSEGFTTLVDMAGTIIQSLAGALGSFLVPLQPLMGAVSLIVSALGQALTPVLTYLGEAIQPLVPVVGMVGMLLSALAPVFAMLTIGMKMIQAPARLLIEGGLRVLFEVLKIVGQFVLTIAMAIGNVWNGIVWEVQNIFRKLAQVEFAGFKPFAFLEDWARDMEGLKAPVGEMATAFTELQDATWDSVDAAAAEEAARLKNKEALDKATESLTNVPRWAKELRRFEAADSRSSPPPSGTPSPYTPAPMQGGAGGGAPPPDSAPGIVMETGSVVINARDPAEALEQLERKVDELRYRKTGSRGRAGRYAYEGT